MRIAPDVAGCVDSPIGQALELLGGRDRSSVLDVAQAAPPYPPAPEVLEHVAAVARAADGAGYTPIPGLPHLREAFAAELSRDAGGSGGADVVRPGNVLISAGCNQAFALAVDTLCTAGDEVVVPLPYYFNHDMWLRQRGVRPVYLEGGPDLLPRVEDAQALLTGRTRAILLVSPGNPTGATLPPERIAAFAALARRAGIALILDETYRSFRGTTAPAHDLYDDPDWGDTLIGLHSFSKDLALPGYRVGAVVASPRVIREVTKVMDCVAVCAPRIGQEAAWAGLTRAGAWRAERAAETTARREGFAAAMTARPGGFELLSTGAFFAWVAHPFPDSSTREVARVLVADHDVLVLPGTAFGPRDPGAFRVSVGNLDVTAAAGLAETFARLGAGS